MNPEIIATNTLIIIFKNPKELLYSSIMINNYSCIGNSIDYAIGEFTIFPQYKKNHFGIKAIQKIFAQYHGKWEIKYSNKNKAAEKFWIKATEKYKPYLSTYDVLESVLSFTVD